MILLRNLAYIAGLAVFYYKYVPLVRPFQMALIPILLLAAGLTWMDRRRGTLFFLFAFPLVNNLPYFFGISEPFPHAPPALVVFLFFFLGVLLNGGRGPGLCLGVNFRRTRPWIQATGEWRAEGSSLDRDPVRNEDVPGPSLTGPLFVLALVVGVSAVITAFRFTNFFPLHGWTVYEIKTNTFGVGAGGALMSVIFQALNYLTGLAFFLILSRTVRTRKDADRALSVLALSSLLSLGFALFQHFGHGWLGNNPTSYLHQLINGTFKDAMSFGAYLSMTAPLFLGLFFAVRSLGKKIVSGVIVLLSFFLVLYTGSKIALFGLVASAVCFSVWAAIAEMRSNRGPVRGSRRKVAFGIGVLAVAGIAVGAYLLKGPILSRAGHLKIVERLKNSNAMFHWRIQAQWVPAVRMMADYPLTGVGMGGFIIESANYTDVYRTSGAIPESAENYLLQVGSELGIAGVLAVIWMAWALLREIQRGFRAKTKSLGSRRLFLSIGAASGILAFLINSQMHSYIGSYEIKYTLWFLIGLLFCLSRQPEQEGPPDSAEGAQTASAEGRRKGGPFRRRGPIAAGVMIIVFGGVHLWNSTHSLSLQSRTEKLGLIQDFGFYAPEKTPEGREFRWTREYGAVPVTIDKPVLSIPIQSAHPDIAGNPVIVRFFLVKELFISTRLLKEIALTDNAWRNVDLPVAGEIGDRVLVLLKVSRTWNPIKVSGAPDSRNLGVAVGKVVSQNR